MLVYFTPEHTRHDPKKNVIGGVLEFMEGSDHGHPECPSRIPAILEAISNDFEDVKVINVTREALSSELELCHSIDLISFLTTCFEKSGGHIEELTPGVFPFRRHGKCYHPSNDPIAELGLYCFDTCTPIGEFSISCAKQSAAAAIDAAKEIDLKNGNSISYVLARPPGHHASYDLSGGFCYFNSAALSAKVLLDRLQKENELSKVSIIDIDYHHGNGTQDIFYDSCDIVYFSIHADPAFDYPHFSGTVDEKGMDKGLGYNFNYPLPPEASFTEHYIPAMKEILQNINSEKYKSDGIIVSLGMDAMDGDPVGSYHLLPDDYFQLGQMISTLSVPVIVIQEGGYNPDRKKMANGISHFLKGLKK